MASNIRRLIWNTRERLTSADLNTTSALHHRALIEGMTAILTQDSTVYGVVRGFVVTSGGASLSVSVSPGLALASGTAPTTYDSATEWVELTTATSVDLTSLVDATNPRWVLIEIADPTSENVELSTSRDTWVPASGTSTSVATTKVQGSLPTLQARAGTAAVTPYFPAGTAGSIPLAYVYIPAAAAAIGASDIVLCRPMISGQPTNEPATAKGGGVAAASLGTTTLNLIAASGRFSTSHQTWQVPTATVSLALAGAHDGAALPAADQATYFYAVPAPYPAGHDATLAPREFVPGATAATRFSSLVPVGVRNCVVLATTLEPTLTSVVGEPAVAGNFSITAAPFSSAAVTVNRSVGAYLGSAYWRNASSGLAGQIFTLGGRVTPRYSASTTPPQADLHDGTSFAATGDQQLRTSAGFFRFPVTAVEVVVHLMVARDAACTNYRVALGDGTASYDFADIRDYFGGTASGTKNYYIPAVCSSTGTINFSIGTAAPGASDLSDVSIEIYWYKDTIIAAR